AIKRSKSYQMFIKYSTHHIPPKKSKKGSQGKKTVDKPTKEVEVFEESEPKPAKKRTTSKRRVKKKVTISVEDDIIPDPDVALELGKSISQTKAEEAEVAKKIHATHVRIVTEQVPKSARRRKSGKLTSDPPNKLKGVPSLTPEEQEAADIMQALNESRKSNRRQPDTGGSDKEIGSIPRVLDESTFIKRRKCGYSNDDNHDVEKDDKDVDSDDEGDHHISDTQDADDEHVESKSHEDEIYKYKIRVRKDEDVDMGNAEVKESHKGDEEHLPKLTKKPTPIINQEKESEKSPSNILKIKKEHVEKQQMPKFTIKSTDKAALKEYDLKSALYQSMHEN
nr:hypothetical protein [Tanacetum cinerariifolium]